MNYRTAAVVPVVPATTTTVVDLSDVESESSEDWDEEEDGWEIESVGSRGGMGTGLRVKEPEWEMLTPVSRGIVV
jgi:hypothetical protein